jgi:hypothetical protein
MLYGMFEGTTEHVMRLTIYTDSYVVRGGLRGGPSQLGDALNGARHEFLLLEGVKFEEFGSHALVEDVPYAQVNLDTVLFAVTESGSLDGGDTPGGSERVIATVPPFRITGRLSLGAGRELREPLTQPEGRFLTLADAVFSSERLNEPRTMAPLLAFNHARAHIIAPHAERDVWAGLGTGAATGEAAGATLSSNERDEIERMAAADPWRDLR